MSLNTSPVIALLGFAALVALAVVVAWPRVGLLARVGRLRRISERVRVEDALKHLYDCETRGVPGTREGLAGVLEIGRGRAQRILERAQELGLVSVDGEAFKLTESGRAYALRVLRTHRLLERFLADRTGVAPGDWHLEAERREHQLSDAQTEGLARRMGHPLYDPHGDPIPSATGELPAARGFALSLASPGTVVTITHLEDEPPEVFQRLLDAGVALGQVLQIEEVSPERIRYLRDGAEHSLARALAGNVTVDLVVEPWEADATVTTLASIEVGQSAIVAGIGPECRGQERRRLLDLGVVPGTEIRAVMRSAGGSPIAYDIRGALIGLRTEQARTIRVRRAPATGAAA